MRLKLIEGRKNASQTEKNNRWGLIQSRFLTAFMDHGEAYTTNGRQRDLIPAIVAGIKFFARDWESNGVKKILATPIMPGEMRAIIKGHFSLYHVALSLVSQISPAEVVQLFPPIKDYRSRADGGKDYYSTMEAVRAAGGAQSFDGDARRANEFLMKCYNPAIIAFCKEGLDILDALRSFDGKEPLMDEFIGRQLGHDVHITSGPVQEKKRRPAWIRGVKGWK